MASAFQANAFQNNAFQTSIVASTLKLSMPVNCVLIGDQLYDRTGRTFERVPGKAGRRIIAGARAGGRISGDSPSFSVNTSGRGYN